MTTKAKASAKAKENDGDQIENDGMDAPASTDPFITDQPPADPDPNPNRDDDRDRNKDKGDELNAEDDQQALREQRDGSRGRAADVEIDPPEAEQNDADWLEGREPNDVVEVAGQRETVEARMARNGQSSPEKRAGATTLH